MAAGAVVLFIKENYMSTEVTTRDNMELGPKFFEAQAAQIIDPNDTNTQRLTDLRAELERQPTQTAPTQGQVRVAEMVTTLLVQK